MVLPAAPNSITMNQVRTELGWGTAALSLNQRPVRELFGKPTAGTSISLNDGRGKSLAGTRSFTAAGNFTFSPPWYNTLYVEVRGGGGGGGEGCGVQDGIMFEGGRTPVVVDSPDRGANGTAGGTSVFYSTTNLVGNGGGAGTGGFVNSAVPVGANGTTSGGSVPAAASLPGGGAGAGGARRTFGDNGSNGGNGGLVGTSFTRGAAGAPVPYTGYTVTVGAAGNGGSGGSNGGDGASGGVGYVYMSWS